MKNIFHYKLHLCVDGKRANDQILYLEKKIQTKKNQFSNTHVFNLFVMEEKGKKKCGFSPHHLLKNKNR